MHFVIDVREACKEHRTGKGQWTYGFVTELLYRGVSCTLLSRHEDFPVEWQDLAKQSSKNIVLKNIYSKSAFDWHFQAAWRVLMMRNTDAYISPTSFLIPMLLGKRVKTVPIVHDLIAFRGEPHERRATWIERWTLPRALKTAHYVCTVSNATKSDLVGRFPFVTPKRVSPIFAGPADAHPAKSEPDGSSIVCIATLCPRKNQLRLIQAYARLPEDLRKHYRLVLAGGRGWDDDPILLLAKATAGVTWIGYVDDDHYRSLLHRCTVFALPSLYEGFGMQILDALGRGTPVLTSSRGSLREVSGDAAEYVDPEHVESITAGLERLLRDADLRKRLSDTGPEQAAQFSWKRTVDLFLDAVSSHT